MPLDVLRFLHGVNLWELPCLCMDIFTPTLLFVTNKGRWKNSYKKFVTKNTNVHWEPSHQSLAQPSKIQLQRTYYYYYFLCLNGAFNPKKLIILKNNNGFTVMNLKMLYLVEVFVQYKMEFIVYLAVGRVLN